MSNWSCNHAMLVVVVLTAPLVAACEADSSAGGKGSPSACQRIEVSVKDAPADATTRTVMNGVRDTLRAACAEDRWSARAITCVTALARHLPATESENERCAAMLTPVQVAHLKGRGEDFWFGPGRTAESVLKDMEAADARAVPVPACRAIKLSNEDVAADAVEQLAVIQMGCANDRWSSSAIACFTALARNLPASESERERCLEMLTPQQERYLGKHGVDLFLSPRRWQEQARKELEAAGSEQEGSGAPPPPPAPPPSRLKLADLVGTWIYRAPDRMEGETTFRIEDNGSFEWTYSPMHDGGCDMGGLASTQPNSNAKVLGNLSVKVSDGSCGDMKVRVWSVRAFDEQTVTLVDELDKSSKVFRRK